MLYMQIILPYLVAFVSTNIKSVSAVCKDPGIPEHAQRTVLSNGKSAPFPTATVMRFSCAANYELDGATKITCELNGKWNAKPPRCKARLCSTQPPIVDHATRLTHINPGVSNAIGHSAKYGCNKGYFATGGSPYKICGKDGQWQGNFTCAVVMCQPPVAPVNGNVAYKSLTFDSVANYRCNNSRYFLYGTNQSRCMERGSWSGSRRCLMECKAPIQPKNGNYVPTRFHIAGRRLLQDDYITYTCDPRFVIHGSVRRYCTATGHWSGEQPTCKINMCGSPGGFSSHGQMTFDRGSYGGPYILGTVVTFRCNHGYRLDGPHLRVCLSDGHWKETKNPTCTAVSCEEPDIQNGQHDHFNSQGRYPYGVKITYKCNAKYHIWGNMTRWCDSKNGIGYWTGMPPLCLTFADFDKKCKEANGQFVLKHNQPHCIEAPMPPTTASSKTKITDNELDTLTIVTASAGSTLGALVILLSILVFVRRFHRSRRFRNSSRGRSLYGDDDRLTLIATYSGDVHFALPSYDEAMSQVHRDPPPFESVVDGSAETNNNPPGGATTTEHAAGNAEVSDSSGGGRVSLEGPAATPADGQINIVNNPLVGGGTGLTRPQRSEGTGTSNQQHISVQEDNASSPSPPSSSGPARGSISDDDVSQSETQPLISSV